MGLKIDTVRKYTLGPNRSGSLFHNGPRHVKAAQVAPSLSAKVGGPDDAYYRFIMRREMKSGKKIICYLIKILKYWCQVFKRQ